MSNPTPTRMQLFRHTLQGEGQPEYVGLIEVPKAGFYWIYGFVDTAKSGEKFIRGELSNYGGPRVDLRQKPERADLGEMQVQPGFWPVARRK